MTDSPRQRTPGRANWDGAPLIAGAAQLLGWLRRFPAHGWLGLALVAVFWTLNWRLSGPRTHWGFFPLWLGYCLAVDGLVLLRTGTSLLTRSWRKYIGLFLVSAPVWWLFEAVNWRLQNWHYQGGELFTPLQFWTWATLSFTTVIPAVFGSAELVASFGWLRRLGRGPVLRPDLPTTRVFIIAGLAMFALMLVWPRLFFPFVWLSVYFILEPLNVWLGNHNLAHWTPARRLATRAGAVGGGAAHRLLLGDVELLLLPQVDLQRALGRVLQNLRDAPAGLRRLPALCAGAVCRLSLCERAAGG